MYKLNHYSKESASLSISGKKNAPVLPALYLLYAACVALACIALVPVGATLSGFFNTELSPANTFTAGVWPTQQIETDSAPQAFVLQLSAPESFTVVDDPPADPPDNPEDTPPADTPTDTPADEPVVEISDPVTTITPPAGVVDSPAETPEDVPADTADTQETPTPELPQ